MAHQGQRLLPLGGAAAAVGGIGVVEQLHQGGGQLLGGAALGMALEGMPLPIPDHQLLVQGLSRGAAALGPAAGVVGSRGRHNHWTDRAASVHPGGMQQRPRSPHQPIRWLHQLAGLMAQISRAERLQAADQSLQARRLRQRMALAQRVLDPLPRPLMAQGWPEQLLWTALRWSGPAMALALWLKR